VSLDNADAVIEGGLLALQKWAESVPRNKAVVLYCGCCPWDKCPNIRPAYDTLKKMGLSQLKVLHIDQDFARDWVQKGLPIEKK
jgi:thiosulfate/3-mercaptopyruvate sulfurtransferase